jgi:Caspase domain
VRAALLSLIFATLLCAPGLAQGEPLRVLVAASQRLGGPGQGALKHADADAVRFRDVMVSLGGVRPEHAIMAPAASRASLLAALDRAAVIARSRPPGEVTFVFYFSGHGDRTHLRLAGETLDLGELSARLEALPATLRLIITDACRTTEPSRTKGMSADAPFAILVDPGRSSGTVWLYASAEGEAAQESDALGGALFTHALVAGLRGAADVNRDGRVTLGEAYDHAYHQTLIRSARTVGVPQRPSAEFRAKEAAPIVLTLTGESNATVSLPPETDTLYLVYASGSRAVVAELWAQPDRATSVALPDGRYIVHRRARSGAFATELVLARGERRTLRAVDFRPFPEEVLAQKGGELTLRHYEVGAALAAQTGSLAPLGGTVAVRAAYRSDGPWAIALRAAGSYGVERTDANRVRLSGASLSALGEQHVPVWSATLRLAAGPSLTQLWQEVERLDAARIEAAGYSGTRHHRALAFGLTAEAALRLPIGQGPWVEALLGGTLTALPTLGDRLEPYLEGRAGLGAGVAF